VVEIRELDPERDADACVALVREASPHVVTNREAWLHRVRSLPERTQLADFVAVVDGQAVAEAYGFLGLFGDDSIAVCNVTVAQAHRRRGIGTALLREIEQVFSQSLLARFTENDEGVAFAAANGFREVRAEIESVVDLAELAAPAAPEADLRPLSAVDPRDAWLIDIEASRDMPSTEEVKDMTYEDWEEMVMRYPLFQADGSFVAYVDGEPAAVSLLVADAESGRSTNWFVGTRRPYRGRGLALAVKLASIAWAREHGVREMVTDNDDRNAPMLAINRKLGFRPASRRVEYLREGTAASPARRAPAT
jgi:ribosomal protein S18 acetylase RimI-like enzyme